MKKLENKRKINIQSLIIKLEKKPFPKEGYTKYELARILGARALQLSFNAPILIKITKEKLEDMRYDPVKIAEMEVNEGILPISIKRPLPRKLEKKHVKESREIGKLEKIEKAEAETEKAEGKEVKKIEKEIEKEAQAEVEEEATEVEKEIEKAIEEKEPSEKKKAKAKEEEKSEEEKLLEEIKSAEKEEAEGEEEPEE